MFEFLQSDPQNYFLIPIVGNYECLNGHILKLVWSSH